MRKLIIPLCAAIIVACLTVPFILLAKKAKEQQITAVPANLPPPEVPSGYVPDSTQDVTSYVLVEPAREVPIQQPKPETVTVRIRPQLSSVPVYVAPTNNHAGK